MDVQWHREIYSSWTTRSGKIRNIASAELWSSAVLRQRPHMLLSGARRRRLGDMPIRGNRFRVWVAQPGRYRNGDMWDFAIKNPLIE